MKLKRFIVFDFWLSNLEWIALLSAFNASADNDSRRWQQQPSNKAEQIENLRSEWSIIYPQKLLTHLQNRRSNPQPLHSSLRARTHGQLDKLSIQRRFFSVLQRSIGSTRLTQLIIAILCVCCVAFKSSPLASGWSKRDQNSVTWRTRNSSQHRQSMIYYKPNIGISSSETSWFSIGWNFHRYIVSPLAGDCE